MCILAMHDSFGRDLHDYDVYTGDLYVDSVYIGNADTYVGWDLHEGEEYGYIGVSADGRDGERVVGSVDPIILADAIRYTLDSWNI